MMSAEDLTALKGEVEELKLALAKKEKEAQDRDSWKFGGGRSGT